MRICVVDLGAMSFHMLHCRIGEHGQLTKLGSSQQIIRFGAGLFRTGVIDTDAWTRGLHAIGELLEQVAQLKPDQLVCVATSAVRDATNGRAFVNEVGQHYGLGVRVLKPESEAELACIGALSDAKKEPVPRVVIDIGGGSIEFSVARDEACSFIGSIQLGVLRLKDAFRITGAVDRVKAESLQLIMRTSARDFAERLVELAPVEAVFASGNARAVQGYIHAVLPGEAPLCERLRAIQGAMIDQPLDYFISKGVHEKRADTVAITSIVMNTLVEMFNVESVRVASRGLREGVALRAWHEEGVSATPLLAACAPASL